ncbi:Outer membrane protein A [Paraburkholderia sediminicola]|uniref:Outer membrane protein A n=1 Tax=Paraburkholderia sediminicola TaxID=458836 RepID=A0A6J5A7L2_9BURK|nr:OmpA family protein [Paraburkholderia sediminicola]CAB3657471.1 Outer membrane protein A [Paraburkholderia sediminicola]
MKLQLTVLAFALALSGCADHAARERLGIEDATVLKTGVGASQDDAAGAANQQWVETYASIVSGRTALVSLQQRLDQLPGDKNSYFHAKAQCWIDAGQQTDDHWGFVEEAIGQAAMITMGLENGTPLSAANPALRTMSTVRPDLWKIVNAIKADSAVARCPEAQKPLACAEVELMQAGHDAWARNFSSAEKRLPKIQESLRKSAETALQCSTVTPEPAVVAPAASVPQKITLRADSLFRFNGGDEASILPAGKSQLDAVATGLKQARNISELNIAGYTDLLGSGVHNRNLSLRRAQTVKQYLRARGVTLPITVQGRGDADQLVSCKPTKRDELVRCLAPNRRVEIEFVRAAP